MKTSNPFLTGLVGGARALVLVVGFGWLAAGCTHTAKIKVDSTAQIQAPAANQP